MNIRKYILMLALCAATSFGLQAKTIIWDLGGVLFAANKFKITLNELGIGTLFGHTILDGKNPGNLQKRAFEVLYTLGMQKGPIHLRLKSPEGLELPQLLVDVLLGEINPQDALRESTELVNKLWQEKKITTKREKKLLLRIMRTIFDTETFAKYMKAIPAGAQLVATCAKDPSCEQFILSNWDAYSFALLHESAEGQKVFAHLKDEHIIISGGCNLVKPSTDIFEYLIETHDLNPKECIFIDDTLENVKSAQACGFNTIYFHNMSHNDLKKILIKHGYLNPNAKSSTTQLNSARV
ncbi:MAG: HAD-IA family hydrolase [Candidatus Babeliales bacterium]